MSGRRHLISREPVPIPRWVITAKYLLFVVLAGIVGWRGLAALDFSRWEGYTSVWGLALAVGSLVAAFASLRLEFERVEKWAAVWVTGWLAVVLVSSVLRTAGSSAAWFYVLMVTLLPAGRAIYLFGLEKRR